MYYHRKRQQPRVLVTGSHRSGTTWVGTVLQAHEEAAYINEPLNVSDGPAPLRQVVRHSYSYICQDNERRFLPGLERVLAAGCQAEECRKAHVRHRWTVIKDPFAIFSAAWFASALNCRSVITVRQPVGMVSSLKRLNWRFDHRHLLDQPLLLRDWLAPFRREMEAVLECGDDVIAEGCLLWRMVYTVAARLRERLPETVLVRHEDLSLDPWGGFGRLFETLGVRESSSTDRAIEFFCSSQNPKEAPLKPPFTVALDSRANLDNWQHRLTDSEVERIRELTAAEAGMFYTQAELENFSAVHRGRPVTASRTRTVHSKAA